MTSGPPEATARSPVTTLWTPGACADLPAGMTPPCDWIPRRPHPCWGSESVLREEASSPPARPRPADCPGRAGLASLGRPTRLLAACPASPPNLRFLSLSSDIPCRPLDGGSGPGSARGQSSFASGGFPGAGGGGPRAVARTDRTVGSRRCGRREGGRHLLEPPTRRPPPLCPQTFPPSGGRKQKPGRNRLDGTFWSLGLYRERQPRDEAGLGTPVPCALVRPAGPADSARFVGSCAGVQIPASGEGVGVCVSQ